MCFCVCRWHWQSVCLSVSLCQCVYLSSVLYCCHLDVCLCVSMTRLACEVLHKERYINTLTFLNLCRIVSTYFTPWIVPWSIVIANFLSCINRANCKQTQVWLFISRLIHWNQFHSSIWCYVIVINKSSHWLIINWSINAEIKDKHQAAPIITSILLHCTNTQKLAATCKIFIIIIKIW